MNTTDPVKVYEHARHVGDHPLTEALARRLFPWRRTPATAAPSASARRTLRQLVRLLRLGDPTG